jgi:hypothetical protein
VAGGPSGSDGLDEARPSGALHSGRFGDEAQRFGVLVGHLGLGRVRARLVPGRLGRLVTGRVLVSALGDGGRPRQVE